MSSGRGRHRDTTWIWCLLATVAQVDGGHFLHAQSCAGQPSRQFSLSGSASSSSEERTLGLSPGVRLGPAYVRFSAAWLVQRAGLGWDYRNGASVALGREAATPFAFRLCPIFGAQWTRRDGARATAISLGLTASQRWQVPGVSSVGVAPVLSAAIHRERVRFDSVAEAGEDYSRYSYSDLFGVIGIGLAVPLKQALWLRGVLALPAGSVAQHPTLTLDVALGF